MFKNSKNVLNYVFGKGSLAQLEPLVEIKRQNSSPVVYFVDEFFEKHGLLNQLPKKQNDRIVFVKTEHEPTTDYVDELRTTIPQDTSVMVGLGGGITLDVTKAIANLVTNGGSSADYQGWDLVKKPGVYKIGVPTLSGTGAEASRTCVLMNYKKNLKLGMNSEFTVYDQLILDPDLTKSVPRHQYFYTGMDTYIHCIESLAGNYRNAIGDAFSREALGLCSDVFSSDEMMSDSNREKIMVASYLGGCAIANSFVGVVHPFSAGLSMVLGLHHCVANCIVMNVMEEFYPRQTEEFHRMLDLQKISIPTQVTANLNEEQKEKLYLSTIVHEKPLANALGENFKSVLTREKVWSVFSRM